MKLITEASGDKLRGGFYTPASIAEFILRWGINGSTTSDILEPSCGDGVFLKEIEKQNLPYNTITAIELDEGEANKAKKINLGNCSVINDDFHSFCSETQLRYDLIVGNPPYIRYQFFDKKQQRQAEIIFDRAGLKYSKLTNAWVSFVVGASLLLKTNFGKIGFVLPAEILQVSYALQLRKFLSTFYNKINIVSFQELVFPKIQQEVVLLLCERNDSKEHNIEHIELRNAEDLKDFDFAKLKCPSKRIDFKSNKWTFYFLEQKEIDFLENIAQKNNIPQLGNYAKVEVGITTGANDFFTVPLSVVNEYDLHNFARPMVGRSVQVNSVVLKQTDWEVNKAANVKAHLLVFPEKSKLAKENGALRYIKYGESIGINKGYKTRIRDDWFVIPSIKASDALFIRRNNLYPRLIINESRAFTTDTMHRVYVKENTNIDALVGSYYNSLTLAFTEVSGRSHGGGVLELMPNEAENILLPYHLDNSQLVPIIDEQIRKKVDIDAILKMTDEIILKKYYKLTDEEISLSNSIWKKLSARRLRRGGKE